MHGNLSDVPPVKRRIKEKKRGGYGEALLAGMGVAHSLKAERTPLASRSP